MTLTLNIELPPEVEQALQSSAVPPDQEVREALAVLLFREGRLPHAELAHAPKLDRFETDAVLKRNQVPNAGLTLADLNADRATLEQVLGPTRPASNFQPPQGHGFLGLRRIARPTAACFRATHGDGVASRAETVGARLFNPATELPLRHPRHRVDVPTGI